MNDERKDPVAHVSKELTATEGFQNELNTLLAKYPTIKLVVQQTITISEKQ